MAWKRQQSPSVGSFLLVFLSGRPLGVGTRWCGDGAGGVMFYIAYDGMDPPCWYVLVWLVNGDNAWKGFTSLSTTCDA